MLSLIYACGLRRSELLNLKPQDIDATRGMLRVCQGKGKKDRMVPISEKVIALLRDYYRFAKPGVYLFEGQISGKAYSGKSLENVMNQAVAKANIKQKQTLHIATLPIYWKVAPTFVIFRSYFQQDYRNLHPGKPAKDQESI